MKVTREINMAACLCLGMLLAFAGACVVPGQFNNVIACMTAPAHESALRFLGLLAGLFALKVVCSAGSSALAYWRRSLELAAGAEIVRHAFARVLRSSPSFFERNSAEGLTRRLLRDAETVSRWRVGLLLQLFPALTGIAIATMTMFFGGWDLSAFGIVAQKGCPELATVVIVLAPAHFFFILVNRIFAREECRQAEASEAQYAVGTEMLRGIVDLRAVNAFSFADSRMEEATRRATGAQWGVQGLLSFLQGTDNAIGALSEVIFMAVAARMIFSLNVPFDYADYAGFVALQMAFHSALSRIVDIGFSWLRARPAAERIRELEALPQIVTDSVRKFAKDTPLASAIRLDSVAVSTSAGKKLATAVSMSVEDGEHVALIGTSGCGKSTVLKTIARQTVHVKGCVELGGIPVSELPFDEFVARVALVSQTPFVFAGTVRENILLGRRDPSGEQELNRILQGVGIPKEALERSLGSGEKGLSGGQIAKVALARAVFGNPQVLLLDEVTAALDGESERLILDFLSAECRRMTVLLVTHRPSSMKTMDRVIRFTSKKDKDDVRS